MRKQGFTLVEIMIVVTILGILAAIAMPTYTEHTVKAKEATVKTDLSLMRAQIELYRLQHNGVVPGYVNGGPAPEATLQLQFAGTSAQTGLASPSTVPTSPFLYGPYVRKLPQNPFNGLNKIAYVADGTEFSAAADGTSSGWLYKKESGEIKLNWTGTDSKGDNYIDY